MANPVMHFAAKFARAERSACKTYGDAVQMTRDKNLVTCKRCPKTSDYYQQTAYLDRCATCGEIRGTRAHFDPPGALRQHRFVLGKEFNPAEAEAASITEPREAEQGIRLLLESLHA